MPRGVVTKEFSKAFSQVLGRANKKRAKKVE